MNIERLTILAQTLDNAQLDPHTNHFGIRTAAKTEFLFDMNYWRQPCQDIEEYSNHCGTVGCIAGLSELLFGSPKELYARTLLGLSFGQSNDLFTPSYCRSDNDQRLRYRDITPQHAAKVIRNLIKTGTVDWSVAFPGYRSVGG